jgi:hypothetical protein
VRKYQIVKPNVDNVVIDVDLPRVVGIGTDIGTDIEQRCRAALGLQQPADQAL